jgi:pyridoxal phosphate enzyme (YggS family)
MTQHRPALLEFKGALAMLACAFPCDLFPAARPMTEPTTPETAAIAARLADVQQAIAAAAAAAGRRSDDVLLLPVSKTFPPETVAAAYACGLRVFGENRVQELTTKSEALPADIQWHMIGRLQRNKAKAAVAVSALIQSVDSPRLLAEIARHAGAAGAVQPILVQVNLTAESTKSGVCADAAEALVTSTLATAHINCRGLMTIGRHGADEAELHRTFAALRMLRDTLAERLQTPLPELSMGMSGDYRIAVAEGATIVRVGSAVFGTRPAG